MPTDNDHAQQIASNNRDNINFKQDIVNVEKSLNNINIWTDNALGQYDLATIAAMQAIIEQLNLVEDRIDDVFDKTDDTLLPTGPGFIVSGVMNVGTDGATQRGFKSEQTLLNPFGELYPSLLNEGVHIFAMNVDSAGDTARVYLNTGFGENITPFTTLTWVLDGVEITLPIVGDHYEVIGQTASFAYLDALVGRNTFIVLRGNEEGGG